MTYKYSTVKRLKMDPLQKSVNKLLQLNCDRLLSCSNSTYLLTARCPLLECLLKERVGKQESTPGKMPV